MRKDPMEAMYRNKQFTEAEMQMTTEHTSLELRKHKLK
jgi:hypothetical protein